MWQHRMIPKDYFFVSNSSLCFICVPVLCGVFKELRGPLSSCYSSVLSPGGSIKIFCLQRQLVGSSCLCSGWSLSTDPGAENTEIITDKWLLYSEEKHCLKTRKYDIHFCLIQFLLHTFSYSVYTLLPFCAKCHCCSLQADVSASQYSDCAYHHCVF